MEVILRKEQKSELDEILDFIKSLKPEEQMAFKYLIDGFKLGRANVKAVN